MASQHAAVHWEPVQVHVGLPRRILGLDIVAVEGFLLDQRPRGLDGRHHAVVRRAVAPRSGAAVALVVVGTRAAASRASTGRVHRARQANQSVPGFACFPLRWVSFGPSPLRSARAVFLSGEGRGVGPIARIHPFQPIRKRCVMDKRSKLPKQGETNGKRVEIKVSFSVDLCAARDAEDQMGETAEMVHCRD